MIRGPRQRVHRRPGVVVHVDVDAIEILERETAPADPRLVGRDDHAAAGPVQPRNRVEASRDRFPVLRGTHVVREILVEHAVPVIAPIAFVIGAMVLAALQGPLTWRTFIDSLMGPRTPRARSRSSSRAPRSCRPPSAPM